MYYVNTAPPLCGSTVSLERCGAVLLYNRTTVARQYRPTVGQ